MTRRLYVARDREVTVVARDRLRVSGFRHVRRRWTFLIETRAGAPLPEPRRTAAGAALVALPPLATGSVVAALATPEAGVIAGGAVFFTSSYLAPLLRRRRAARELRGQSIGLRRLFRSRAAAAGAAAGAGSPWNASGPAPVVGSAPPSGLASASGSAPASGPAPGSGSAPASGLGSGSSGAARDAGRWCLTAEPERSAFHQAIEAADRISETWPGLEGLVDVPVAERLLAEALWEIAGLLARRQELSALLVALGRPDFAPRHPADGTAFEVHTRLRATREALMALEVDLAHREASLRHAEEAGCAFLREQAMRRTIGTADDLLGPGRTDLTGRRVAAASSAADLAERTRAVLIAYQELTADRA